MKMYKFLSAVVACIAITANVFAADEATYPEADVENLSNFEITTISGEEITLDYGMNFKYDPELDPSGTAFDEYHVDYEITFSEDTVAVLAGCYGEWESGSWIAIKSDDPSVSIGPINNMGFKFEKGKTYRVLYDCAGAADPENEVYASYTVPYQMIKDIVKEFACGLKFGSNTVDGTTVELKLCMYDPEDEGVAGTGVQIGDAVTYTYERTEPMAINTTSDYGYYAEAYDAEPTGGAVSFNAVYNHTDEVEEVGMYLYATGETTKQAFVNTTDVEAMMNGEFNSLVDGIPAEALDEVFIAMPYVVVDGEVITGELCVVDDVTAGKWLGAANAQII